MGEETCETCRWWDETDRLKTEKGVSQGRCRVQAPRLFDPEDYAGRWPITEVSDFCGEHQPRIPLPVAPA